MAADTSIYGGLKIYILRVKLTSFILYRELQYEVTKLGPNIQQITLPTQNETRNYAVQNGG
jgi:hypothetical protein